MILVTGGAGFIGSNFVLDWLAQSEEPVVNLDKLTYAGNTENLRALDGDARHVFVHGDICDRDRVAALLREERIDTIVNFAAESHVDRSIKDPQSFLRTNVMGTHALLEAARSTWPDPATGSYRFHHVSTDEVYGSLGPADPAFTESTPYAPNSPYSASKAAADHVVRAYVHTFATPCTISNCSNNYGPYQFPEKLLPLCIVNILEGRPLPIYGDGLQIRDWLHVQDHCRAIDHILRASGIGETWNVGAGSSEPNIRVVEAVCELVDLEFRQRPELKTRYPHSAPARGQPSRSLITHVKDRLGHDRRYAVDGGKIARLGFRPGTALDGGLASTVRWYLEHESWWRAIVSGEYRSWYARQYAAAT